MKTLKKLSTPFITFLFLLGLNSIAAYAKPTLEELHRMYEQPPSGIDTDVWKGALTSYLSQCAGGGECKCALVVAQGIDGDIKSTNMWIGTLARGNKSTLWSGNASRFASTNQNDTSVNMPTKKCKKRVGDGAVSGDKVCIGDRKPCPPVSHFRNLMQELGIPETVAYTSFYFSTPLQEELYKFHDFYPCNTLPCPQTLGCLGLERHAMKALCLNHMGSDGTNGIDSPEKGGVWLYFHNINAPPSKGNETAALQGLENFKQNTVCSNTSTANLSTGAPATTESYTSSRGRDNDSSRSPAEDKKSGIMDSAMEGIQGLAGLSAENQEDMQAQVETCAEILLNSCPELEANIARDYCINQDDYERKSCEFTATN